MDTTEFWKIHGHLNIKPGTGGEFPEGWDVRPYLAKLCDGLVTEIGCGDGRLSTAFEPEHYIGIDISAKSLEMAESKNKNYKYILHNHGDSYPEADVRLLYTVLLHIDDDCIGDMIKNLCEGTDTVVVAEIMARVWRREGDPPVFNREADEYIALFEKCGFENDYHYVEPYERYKDNPLGAGDITFLRFKRG